jgi:hypothetical protein
LQVQAVKEDAESALVGHEEQAAPATLYVPVPQVAQ